MFTKLSVVDAKYGQDANAPQIHTLKKYTRKITQNQSIGVTHAGRQDMMKFNKETKKR
jgi:hypothetical protein